MSQDSKATANCHTNNVAGLNFGSTVSDDYWSVTATPTGQYGTWAVDFINGFVGVHSKADFNYVRAVRGGW